MEAKAGSFSTGSSGKESFAVVAPSISLPKGGGAIRGIGEKFAANPVTGTGSMRVPIAVSPARSGFGPQLSLSYDSGAGNGPFGLGWNLSLPSITRKTDKGLPRYNDAEESDVFILSGSEDLVPCLEQVAPDDWQPENVPPRTVDGKTYDICRYRPRIEGSFARIERWANRADLADVFWRSISKDNITTWYGKSEESRIYDPDDATRVFSWLICVSYDDKGNAVVYSYQRENAKGVDGSFAHEANRNEPSRVRKANTYLKRIKYGNRAPNRDRQSWEPTDPATIADGDWLFQIVFDYDDGHYGELPLDVAMAEANRHRYVTCSATAGADWKVRVDPFSSYRAGFEVRNYRRCRRVLMFHNFAELGISPCLVRATEFDYDDFDYGESFTAAQEVAHPGSTRLGSILRSVTQSGYLRQRDNNGAFTDTYLKRSLPPLEFQYSRATIDETVRDVDDAENLPAGVDGSAYQWVDLDGEGLSGVLTEQAGAWFYKRNMSALPVENANGTFSVKAHFEPHELASPLPSAPGLASGRQQFLDLAGDGQVDVVEMDSPTPGFFERTDDGGWESLRRFRSMPNLAWKDPNLRFVDLTGDGHADILITENDAFTWCASLAEEGFAPAMRMRQALDEEKGPRLVFADATQSIYLSDMSGDGLTDLVRIRNGEVCYWPNLGYCRWGKKVTMDNSPWFDAPDQFDQRRIRLADIDGSGTTDILYLGAQHVDIYRNQLGNAWAARESLAAFPRIDDLSSVTAVDLLGNGTACLVWSSPLPGDARCPMRYIDLMGGQKPHLLIRTINNLGAETRVQYAPSTKFYLVDEAKGKPWITRVPFPVHVVERVETYDHISKNRFVTRYAYHHGYFDGFEREFRGFGMVEQWDTEEFKSLFDNGGGPQATNVDRATHVPPVLTKTWFHTGVYLGRNRVSRFFAGLLDGNDRGEYFREPGLTDNQAQQFLLDDTILPDALAPDEEREACRALKGSMLRQEIYALDGSERAAYPYTVTEQNFAIQHVQGKGQNLHGVFFTHPRETINYHYERNADDPRVSHSLTLAMDDYGNIVRSLTVAYRRRPGVGPHYAEQEQTHLTFTANRVANRADEENWYRIGLPVETRTYEIVNAPEPIMSGSRVVPVRFEKIHQMLEALWPEAQQEPDESKLWPYESWDWRRDVTQRPPETRLRLVEDVRTLYRKDDMTDLLKLGTIESQALPGERYKLAFTPELLTNIYRRPRDGQLPENLLSVGQDVIGGQGADQGGYLSSHDLKVAEWFPNADPDDHWWLPSGRVFFHPDADVTNPSDTAVQELAEGRRQFFLPRKYANPFGQGARLDYDGYALLIAQTQDALGNRVIAQGDYRVLQPKWLTDPNGNRSSAAFDALGLLVATAVAGKDGENVGDTLEDFDEDTTLGLADPVLADIQRFVENPRGRAEGLLRRATTRIVYDLDRYRRCGQPPFAATLGRETHVSESPPSGGLKIQIGFGYSDGFGREIQKKAQAEPGDAPQRDPETVTVGSGDVEPGPLVIENGKPRQQHTTNRWVGKGRTVFNNKGKLVKLYEPFFSSTHLFEEEPEMTMTGVTPVIFYDPLERVVATLHPNHTYEKVVFDPWQRTNWDANDTVLQADPRVDPDVGKFFRWLPESEYLPTWRDMRMDPAKSAAKWPGTDPDTIRRREDEERAAEKTAAHAGTPGIEHFDTLGRSVITVANNGLDAGGQPLLYHTRLVLDIEGNQREVIDARERVVMRYEYDLLGNRVHQASMDASERWMLSDVTGNSIRAWDSRGHNFRIEYDALRRPVRRWVIGVDAHRSDGRVARADETLYEQIEYGEAYGDRSVAAEKNLLTRVWRQMDASGIATNERYDFKGNPLRASRQLAKDYQNVPDWSRDPALEDEHFLSSIRYDALNRPIQLVAPHSDRTGVTTPVTVNAIRPGYNEANLLERLDVWLELPGEPIDLLDPATASAHGVTNIDYDAKGQRMRIEYKNGVTTRYTYDDETFRLIHLETQRPNRFAADARMAQDLRYAYDPVGNITSIRDQAQHRIIHDNDCVDASAEYLYDAIYRLIAAKGREHKGQDLQSGWDDAPRCGNRIPNDCQALRNYVETYRYDAVGNIMQMAHHQGSNVASPGQAIWNRRYQYLPDNNRLLSTSLPGDAASAPDYATTAAYSETYGHDVHGNIINMPHLSRMSWDFEDQLQATARQRVDAPDCNPETTYYVYDASGRRVRKVTECFSQTNQSAKRTKERIYLNAFEIYREYDRNDDTVELERETLHVMDDKQRIALVETRTIDTYGSDEAPRQLVRYQQSNHLASAVLELDHQAQVISYEEYYPYGDTAYQAARSQTETAKRYRYSRKERDEESGFYYYGARYYAPWLGRWTAADPIRPPDHVNLYCYVYSSPVCGSDPNGKQTTFGQFHLRPPNDVIPYIPLNRLLPREREKDRLFSVRPKSARHSLVPPKLPTSWDWHFSAFRAQVTGSHAKLEFAAGGGESSLVGQFEDTRRQYASLTYNWGGDLKFTYRPGYLPDVTPPFRYPSLSASLEQHRVRGSQNEIVGGFEFATRTREGSLSLIAKTDDTYKMNLRLGRGQVTFLLGNETAGVRFSFGGGEAYKPLYLEEAGFLEDPRTRVLPVTEEDRKKVYAAAPILLTRSEFQGEATPEEARVVGGAWSYVQKVGKTPATERSDLQLKFDVGLMAKERETSLSFNIQVTF